MAVTASFADACRRGDFNLCVAAKIAGVSFDGGYQEYMVAPAEAVAAIPEGLPADEAAPLLRAGITVYNSLRNAGARSGVVAVQGIGGLGRVLVSQQPVPISCLGLRLCLP